MKLTRRSFTTLAGMAVAATAVGCGSNDPTTAGDNAGETPKAGDKFTFWSMWKEGEDQQKVLASEIANFTKDTGIEVDVQWSGREVLTQVVPRLNAGNPPDLVDNGSPDFISKLGVDNLMDLSDVYAMEIPGEEGSTVSDVVPEALMASMQNDSGQPFLVPYEIIGTTVWFNGKVTPRFADTAPTTWDDFTAALDDLKAEGRTPLALDGDIADYCAYWVEWGVLRAGGPGAISDAATDPSGAKFMEPAWVAATDNVEKLITGGYFPDGFRGSKFPTQQASWADQSSKTDLILMGSWLPSEASASLEKSGGDPLSIEFGSFPFPSVGENKGEGLVQAQPVGFAIPAKSKQAAAAKQFVAYFMQKDRVGRIASEAKNLTPRTDVEPPADLKDFADEYKNAKTIVLISDGVGTVEPKWVTDIWQPAIGKLFDGNLTAEAFRQELADKTVTYHENA